MKAIITDYELMNRDYDELLIEKGIPKHAKSHYDPTGCLTVFIWEEDKLMDITRRFCK